MGKHICDNVKHKCIFSNKLNFCPDLFLKREAKMACRGDRLVSTELLDLQNENIWRKALAVLNIP